MGSTRLFGRLGSRLFRLFEFQIVREFVSLVFGDKFGVPVGILIPIIYRFGKSSITFEKFERRPSLRGSSPHRTLNHTYGNFQIPAQISAEKVGHSGKVQSRALCSQIPDGLRTVGWIVSRGMGNPH